MRNVSGLLFSGGLAFLLLVMVAQLPFGQPLMLVGQQILQVSPNEVGTANVVAAVLLAYRGIDTLGELAILFTAASGVGLILGHLYSANSGSNKKVDKSGFITLKGTELMVPLLLVVGFYIIFYGHVTPGGGFQGGVILAIAFFLPTLVRSDAHLDHQLINVIEGLAGAVFILIGLWAMLYHHAFLQPFFNSVFVKGHLGDLFSAGTLPLLYLALGLKVGAELAGLLSMIADFPELTGEQNK